MNGLTQQRGEGVDPMETKKKGCGKLTNVAGTNGGKMPCGATLTMLGTTEPYYCAECEPVQHS